MSSEHSALIDERISALESRVEALEKVLHTAPEQALAQSKPLSPKEFLLKYSPRDDVSKTLLIAYFIEFIRCSSPFTVADIEAVFREAKESVPGNINDKMYQNVKKGLMMDHKEKKENKKAWVLTATGQRWCEDLSRG